MKCLERLAGEDMLIISQQDGTVAKFPKSASKEAFMIAMKRLGGGPDVPPRHPLLEAARNSSYPRWRLSYFSDIDDDGATTPIEDLSE